MYICIHTPMYTYTDVYTYMYTCMYTYVMQHMDAQGCTHHKQLLLKLQNTHYNTFSATGTLQNIPCNNSATHLEAEGGGRHR